MEPSNKPLLAHLHRFTQQVNVTYQAMHDERVRLALWEDDQDISILGEVELLTTQLQGYAGQILLGRCEHPHEVLAHLQHINPFETQPLSHWYITWGEKYPQISHYLETLDYLRLLMVEYLRQKTLQIAA